MATIAKPTKPDPEATRLTPPEVAWVTRLSISAVYARLRDGRLKSSTDGGKRFVMRNDLDEYLNRPQSTTEDPGHGRGRRSKAAA